MTADLKRTIGRRLHAARRQSRLTQEQLAEKIGRSPEAVSNIERGVSLPTLDTLDRIAQAMNVPRGLSSMGSAAREAGAARRSRSKLDSC